MEIGGLHALAALRPEKELPVTICVGTWVGQTAGWGAVDKRVISAPTKKSNPNFLPPSS
jgi:hypothetical protein